MTTCPREGGDQKEVTTADPPSSLTRQTILDQSGAKSTQCCLLRNGLLVVARDEGLYDYTLDTRCEPGHQCGSRASLKVMALLNILVNLVNCQLFELKGRMHCL